MSKQQLEMTDAEIDRLLVQEQAHPANPLIAVRYSRSLDAIVLEFENGLYLRIPRHLLQGLDKVPAGAALLSRITVLGMGTAIAWDDLDVSFSIDGLLEGMFGSHEWMSQLARRAGRVKSARKADSSRENGRRGGRPRKERVTG